MVGHGFAFCISLALVIAPGVIGIFQPAARRKLPFGFCGQILSRPTGIRHGVFKSNVHHRLIGAAFDLTVGAFWMAP